jgi:hypothetical protein
MKKRNGEEKWRREMEKRNGEKTLYLKDINVF